MRLVGMMLALTVLATAASAQSAVQQSAPEQPASAIQTFTSAADVTALIAKAKSERKQGQPIVVQHLLQLPPYNANLEYRASVGAAAVHEREAEIFYVIDGSATLVTGGKLVNETRMNPSNLSGTAIDGGTPQRIAKGDFIVVPENTPHWFSAIDGTLVLMSVHVPRPVPTTP